MHPEQKRICKSMTPGMITVSPGNGKKPKKRVNTEAGDVSFSLSSYRSFIRKSFAHAALVHPPLSAGGTGKGLCLAAVLIFRVLGFSAIACAGICHHDLRVELQPESHRLLVQDDIRIAEWKGGDISLLLSDRSNIKSVMVNGKPAEYRFQSGRLTVSRVFAVGGPLCVSVSFDAVFNDPVVSEAAGFDNPGFGVAGSMSDRGTFLLADSGWYPSFAECSQDFKLQVTAPRGIYAVTAGELIGHEDRGANSISRWKIDPIGQGLSLSAGRYIVRSRDSASGQSGSGGSPPGGDSASRPPGSRSHRSFAGGDSASRRVGGRSHRLYTYFTSQTDPLSQTYLDAAASHIEFYERLHGPYPFPKFAVVENFFPTGYGFPSYTLLGASVLQLPFIPQTSLRHEIAHSWWGNGVLVNYASGNWCEGLTTYVADYLSQETAGAEGSGESGRGASPPEDARLYRRQILQDYATLVASGADFPLRLFQGRVSPATRAVGYGKAAFVFHMIRQKLGDEVFWRCLRQIYKERLFLKTSWEDFRNVFVAAGGWDPKEAGVFFDQWIARSGAPVLKLQDVRLESDASGWHVTGRVLQYPPWYALDITAGLKVSAAERLDTKIRIKDGSASFSIQSPEAPQKLILDPDVNVFRLLSAEEIPATVNSVKGSKSPAAVLSDGSPPGAVKAFELLLAGLDHEGVPIMSEKEAETKMSEERDWLFFGLPRSEKLKSFFSSAPEDVTLSSEKFSVKGFCGADCLFLVFTDQSRGGGITALFLPVSGTSAESVLTAARKITHYGKYSYLAFSRGIIQKKGVWEVLLSPLEFDFIRK